tara:strand:- start:284 stop:442 length:159 start_codon:yes stop_codon:yes gene_type:complete
MPAKLFGYLDPGTFSYLGSLLVGLIVGLFVYIKIIWIKIKGFVNKIFDKKID